MLSKQTIIKIYIIFFLLSIRTRGCMSIRLNERNHNCWHSNCLLGRTVGSCGEKKVVWNPARYIVILIYWQWHWQLSDAVHFSSAAKTHGTCFYRWRFLVKMCSLGPMSWLPSAQMTLKYRNGGGWLPKLFPFYEGAELRELTFPVLCCLGHAEATDTEMCLCAILAL